MAKRPVGRPPLGAIWLEDEGRYEYTQEYFEMRKQAIITHREKSKIRARMKNLQRRKSHPTLDAFIRVRAIKQ